MVYGLTEVDRGVFYVLDCVGNGVYGLRDRLDCFENVFTESVAFLTVFVAALTVWAILLFWIASSVGFLVLFV